MKIAYFTSIYPRASDSFIRTEIKELRKQGFCIETFAVRKPGEKHMTTEEISQEFRNTHYLLEHRLHLFLVFFLQLITHPIRFFNTFLLALKTRSPGIKAFIWQCAYFIEACYLARLLKKKNIQHLHNHIAEASATVAMLASKLSRIPFSQTVHGPGIFYNAERWALGEKIAQSQFTRCISDFCKSQCMVFAKKEDWKKLHVIHCCADNVFQPTPHLKPAKEPRFLTIGRLEPLKGHFFLLEAAQNLIREGIFCDFTIIGDGPLRKDLEEAIISKNLEKNVKILGWQPASRVKEEMESSRAIICSSFNEGLPVVIMEALALEIPVVAPAISGIPELVIHGQNGYLYSPGSVEQLVKNIKKILILDPKDLKELGKRGAEMIQSDFNAAIETKKLAQLYNPCCK